MENVKDFGSVQVKRAGSHAFITMNRPEKMNALNPELFHGLQSAVKDVKDDSSVRAVILTGAGEHFSAGGDVKEDIDPLRGMNLSEFRDYFRPLNDLYLDIYNLQKPTIAAVNGYALGAGMELALVCDIRIASETAQMGEFFVRMGLIPETGMCLLPKIVGPSRAKIICFTGDTYDAKSAQAIRLVDEVVPAAELMPRAEKLAVKLANGPESIRIMKNAINQFSLMDLAATVDLSVGCQFQATRTEDHKEAVTAFLEKRKPKFCGR